MKYECNNCREEFEEEELNEVRVNGTRTTLFICEICLEDIETFTLIL